MDLSKCKQLANGSVVFMELAAPLYELATWTARMHKAFETLKMTLTQAPSRCIVLLLVQAVRQGTQGRANARGLHCDQEPYEPRWSPNEIGREQAEDPDIGPIVRQKAEGDDCPNWEEISPESRETKILATVGATLHSLGGAPPEVSQVGRSGCRYQFIVPELQQHHFICQTHRGEARAHFASWNTGSIGRV